MRSFVVQVEETEGQNIVQKVAGALKFESDIVFLETIAEQRGIDEQTRQAHIDAYAREKEEDSPSPYVPYFARPTINEFLREQGRMDLVRRTASPTLARKHVRVDQSGPEKKRRRPRNGSRKRPSRPH